MKTPTVKDISSIEFIGRCSDLTILQINKLLDGTTKANGKSIKGIIKHFMPELDDELTFGFYNPYEWQSSKKKGLLVYVHSAIEYFFSIKIY